MYCCDLTPNIKTEYYFKLEEKNIDFNKTVTQHYYNDDTNSSSTETPKEQAEAEKLLWCPESKMEKCPIPVLVQKSILSYPVQCSLYKTDIDQELVSILLKSIITLESRQYKYYPAQVR